MSKNKTLSAAKSAKNDEFYTQYADIQKEINAYLDYDPDTFRGKTVLLPCDDPEWSKFTRFFAENFERLGLKKLISTSYAAASKKFFNAETQRRGGGRAGAPRTPSWYQPTLFEQESPQFDEKKTAVRGKIFVLDHDTNANGRIDLDDLEWKYLEGDGDFRSEEVCKLRDEADVIVTNPPFSLFREFLAWILGTDGEGNLTQRRGEAESEEGVLATSAFAQCASVDKKNAKGAKSVDDPVAPKQFLIIGNMNAITYKEVFPLIKSNSAWLGATGFMTDMVFAVPKGAYVAPADKAKAERLGYVGDYTRLGNSCWFTNLEHGRRHQPLQLMTMSDNLRYSRHKDIKEHGYQHYDNYDAIEVPFTDAIPGDYDGVMGVPISFLDKYCPDQFEILGMTDRGNVYGIKTHEYTEEDTPNANDLNRRGAIFVDGVLKSTYARILIRARRSK